MSLKIIFIFATLAITYSWKISLQQTQKHFAKIIVSGATGCLISLNPYAPISNARAATTLEQSVVQLETASNRADALQAMADVFETSGVRSLQAKTKFKERIIRALNEQHIKLSANWDQALNYASGEVKRRVDPYRTVDLGPYLKIAPYLGGVYYLGALAVQQALPELFIFAYPLAVFALTAPIIYIITFT